MSYSGNHPRFSKKSDERFDAKEAYNKDVSSKARMHYLENDIADHKGMSRYGTHEKSPASNYSVEKGAHSHPHKDGMSRMSPLNNSTQYLKGMAGSMNRKGMQGDSYSVPAEKLDSIQKSEGMSRKSSPLNDMSHKGMSPKELHDHGMKSHPANPPKKDTPSKDGKKNIGDITIGTIGKGSDGPGTGKGKPVRQPRKPAPSSPRKGVSRKISAKRAAKKVAKGKGEIEYAIGGIGPDNAPGGKNNKGTYRKDRGSKTITVTKGGETGEMTVKKKSKGKKIR